MFETGKLALPGAIAAQKIKCLAHDDKIAREVFLKSTAQHNPAGAFRSSAIGVRGCDPAPVFAPTEIFGNAPTRQDRALHRRRQSPLDRQGARLRYRLPASAEGIPEP